MTRMRTSNRAARRAAVLVFFAAMLLVIVGLVAFALDVGRMVLVRTQLQVAADSAAIAAASQLGHAYDGVYRVAHDIAGEHRVAECPVEVFEEDVEIGVWDARTRTFTPSNEQLGNAVRVTAYRDAAHGGAAPLFFARVFHLFSFEASASAVAMASPRDIALVVDLSGSMNDDTEPCWATDAINEEFGPDGYPTIGSELVEKVFEDFGYGPCPGTLEYLGQPWGVPQNDYAYAELTKNGGPLTRGTIPAAYRIQTTDNEATRKTKAYSIIIDQQLARIMPQARPTLNSGANYAYWEKYLDYIVSGVRVGTSGSGRPPNNRGALPPNQDSDRVTGMNNPNPSTFPAANAGVVRAYRNRLGYLTYVQFMMDCGRDLQPVAGVYVPLSRHSGFCPWHDEETAGGVFSFPPREQPTHASRRAIIAAIDVIRQRNALVEDPNQRDWVSIIRFDRLTDGGPVVHQPLTPDYETAMTACTELQAVSDVAASTATDAGLITAAGHIKSRENGGQGRRGTDKVVVLLTDGVPNLTVASAQQVSSYIAGHPSDDYYAGGSVYYNSPLVEAARMQGEHWMVFPVALGLGSDYGFMDRMARLGGTAGDDGQSPRGSGNPAEYEQRLIEIFEKIITSPQVRLVQ